MLIGSFIKLKGRIVLIRLKEYRQIHPLTFIEILIYIKNCEQLKYGQEGGE